MSVSSLYEPHSKCISPQTWTFCIRHSDRSTVIATRITMRFYCRAIDSMSLLWRHVTLNRIPTVRDHVTFVIARLFKWQFQVAGEKGPRVYHSADLEPRLSRQRNVGPCGYTKHIRAMTPHSESKDILVIWDYILRTCFLAFLSVRGSIDDIWTYKTTPVV
jgi:hypothetical protein